jgi:hypothetical protein
MRFVTHDKNARSLFLHVSENLRFVPAGTRPRFLPIHSRSRRADNEPCAGLTTSRSRHFEPNASATRLFACKPRYR